MNPVLRFVMALCIVFAYPHLIQYSDAVYFVTIAYNSGEFLFRLARVGLACCMIAALGQQWKLFQESRARVLEIRTLNNRLWQSKQRVAELEAKLKKIDGLIRNLVVACSCPIRMDILRAPTILRCGHLFEQEEVHRILRSPSPLCCVCKEPAVTLKTRASKFIQEIIGYARELEDAVQI